MNPEFSYDEAETERRLHVLIADFDSNAHRNKPASGLAYLPKIRAALEGIHGGRRMTVPRAFFA